QELVKRSGILVFASHSNDFLAQLCNTALWIDHGHVRKAGLVDEVVEAYEGKGAGDYVRSLLQRFDEDGQPTPSP
ncbi:MAG: ABC transporter ATP-binding protein, partial [Corynebacterium marinum]|nr:ABC transporter ATP-binding protein [Corynebacterium marinum]